MILLILLVFIDFSCLKEMLEWELNPHISVEQAVQPHVSRLSVSCDYGLRKHLSVGEIILKVFEFMHISNTTHGLMQQMRFSIQQNVVTESICWIKCSLKHHHTPAWKRWSKFSYSCINLIKVCSLRASNLVVVNIFLLYHFQNRL